MGAPIEKCKEVMRGCLHGMRRNDVFRVIKFSGSTEAMSAVPLRATPDQVSAALAWVDQMRGSGGTEMMGAINAIFDAPEVRGRKRLVLFMTDGYVGNEAEIIATARTRLGHARVFTLGVGSAANRYLLEGLAYVGRGECTVIRQDGDAAKATASFYDLIDAPVLTDIELKWKGVEVQKQQPAAVPDLFQARPLVVYGTYRTPGTGTLVIRGRRAGVGKVEMQVDVTFPQTRDRGGVIPALWARRAVSELALLGQGVDPDRRVSEEAVRAKVLKLGLQYRIMTQYTSFVAVDDAVRNATGTWVPMEQAVEIPEGVDPASHPSWRYAAGDPRDRVTGKGTLGIIGGQCFGKGGFASDIDAVLGGVGGLTSGGKGSVGRKGMAGIGYGAGYGSGFGGGAGGVDDQISSLMGAGSATSASRGTLKLTEPTFIKGGALTGGRSKASIMRVVMQNLAALRYEFARRLREKPGLSGRIDVKFAIDEFGKVIFSTVVSSTVGDSLLEAAVLKKVNRWVFDKIDKPGDVTEVVYPFVFSR
jgi:Ca-activated chloride channel family protein